MPGAGKPLTTGLSRPSVLSYIVTWIRNFTLDVKFTSRDNVADLGILHVNIFQAVKWCYYVINCISQPYIYITFRQKPKNSTQADRRCPNNVLLPSSYWHPHNSWPPLWTVVVWKKNKHSYNWVKTVFGKNWHITIPELQTIVEAQSLMVQKRKLWICN